MRTSGLVATAFLCIATPAWAQPPQVPLGSVAPAPGALGMLGPRTVVPALIACTDLPTAVTPIRTLYVRAPHIGDSHQASYRGDVVVLSGGTPQGLAIGQRYFTRRVTPPLFGEPLTSTSRASIRTSGWLTVIAADERAALARIDYACDAIGSGDYLELFVESTLPAAVAADGPTDFSNLGQVLFGPDRRQSFGAGDFLSLDRGSAQGLTPGMRIAFYRDRRNGTPLVELGGGIVVEIAPDTAKVIVERAREEVRLGDYFGIRRAP